MTVTRKGRGPTTEQLRHDIDTGKTHDKIDHPDPATAPLGTDAEAGGASPLRVEIERARKEERKPANGP